VIVHRDYRRRRGFDIEIKMTLDEFRFWVVGSIAGRDAGVTLSVLPVVAAGLAIAFAAGRSLNALALGDEVARALGQDVARARAAASVDNEVDALAAAVDGDPGTTVDQPT